MASKTPNKQTALKPQDIVVVLALLCRDTGADMPKDLKMGGVYADLSTLTGLAPSAVHSAIKRAVQSKLVVFIQKDATVIKTALIEFMVVAAKYAFPPVWGALTRGLPTAYAAAPLNTHIAPSNDPSPVWPYPQGKVRGIALAPLYPTVPACALANPRLYGLLALLDALRSGQTRERELAKQLLNQALA